MNLFIFHSHVNRKKKQEHFPEVILYINIFLLFNSLLVFIIYRAILFQYLPHHITAYDIFILIPCLQTVGKHPHPVVIVCPGLFKHLNYFGDNVGRVEEVITVRFRYYSCYTVFISVFHLQRLVFIRPRPPLCILCSDNPVPVRSLSPDLLSLRD